ncbi:CLUMA_CG003806, isoform A [Clunio marinus]|uniref:CLUMA_CG003806, isoform A n=1 Tax=Clunio marinus TaxID=568069 RepID=A0A1J1HPV4_9DIPT|nr:CLUMA_CG003806, isoform A [Clunio marinus]
MKFLIFIAFCGLLGSSSLAFEEFAPFMVNSVRSAPVPYYVFIQYFNAQNLGFFGGGALISTRHVLTSAVNVVGFARVTVYAGSSNRTAMRELAVSGAANAITSHPQYDAVNRNNDIAIIRLQTPIIPTAEIHHVAIPPTTTPALVLPFENEEGFVPGFGFQNIGDSSPTQFLYRGYQRTIGATRCLQFFGVNPTNTFCAEDNVERSNGCQGDIGNPFVISYRRSDVLAGILSMHAPCGQWSPSAYTRITQYLPWINEQLAIN